MKTAVQIDPKKIAKLKKELKSKAYIDKALNGLADILTNKFQ